MLCDLRDLSGCGQVSRRWYSVAQGLLYRSVRIDAVHYCLLEEELAERRKQKITKFRSSRKEVDAVDVPQIRLQLFARTVRENAALATQVQFVKLPYMTRETAKGDLARAVSVLGNLRYVDLPEGFYSGDLGCMALRQELSIRCPDIRKMVYKAGAEEDLEMLAQRHWQNLEVLELEQLAIEPATLRMVLAGLPVLHELSLSDMAWVDDDLFQPTPHLPDFPPLQVLKLIHIPNVSAQGLEAYLQAAHAREMLFSLTLRHTGVTINELSAVLWVATSLQHLSATEKVTKSLGLNAQELPPLTSSSLKSLHFEITSSEDVHGLQKPAESHYAYLANSLHRNALPALNTLYVRDPTFPDLLLMPPLPAQPQTRTSTNPYKPSGAPLLSPGQGPRSPMRHKSSINDSAASNGYLSPHSSTNGHQNPARQTFNQTLEVFTKGTDELEWVFTSITPPTNTQNSNAKSSLPGGRPVSAYIATKGLGPQWAQVGFGGEARKSVVVGNGFGGFLAIPDDEAAGPRLGGLSEGEGGRWAGAAATPMRASFLKPPSAMGVLTAGQEKRYSKHDLWR